MQSSPRLFVQAKRSLVLELRTTPNPAGSSPQEHPPSALGTSVPTWILASPAHLHATFGCMATTSLQLRRGAPKQTCDLQKPASPSARHRASCAGQLLAGEMPQLRMDPRFVFRCMMLYIVHSGLSMSMYGRQLRTSSRARSLSAAQSACQAAGESLSRECWARSPRAAATGTSRGVENTSIKAWL